MPNLIPLLSPPYSLVSPLSPTPRIKLSSDTPDTRKAMAATTSQVEDRGTQ